VGCQKEGWGETNKVPQRMESIPSPRLTPLWPLCVFELHSVSDASVKRQFFYLYPEKKLLLATKQDCIWIGADFSGDTADPRNLNVTGLYLFLRLSDLNIRIMKTTRKT
jgi:hypothetical protein